MMRMRSGDPVTVVWRDDEAGYAWTVAHGQVTLVITGAAVDIETDAGQHLRLATRREGVDWIRGHYASGSVEVRALQAAALLAS